jgi:eukaryotic-like serine/threonine-protein kinase
MATQMAAMGPTLPEAGRGAAASPAPVQGPRPRSISVLPTVQMAAGGEVSLIHHDAERYRTLGVLGTGGMGVVERAEDLDIGRAVAIKRLLPEASHDLGVARFVSEIRIVGSLDHPNVVPIHDVGVDADGRYFFVMKYVEGQTLADIIDRLAAGDLAAHAFWSFERRAELMIAVLQALDYAHERGIIHRDIKPENIMVGTHGEVRLMDWGIARRVGQPEPGEDGTAGLIGTPAYMSPEQAACGELDARSDLYSASVTMHEFLTLRHYLTHRADSVYTLIEAVQHESIAIEDLGGPAGPQANIPPELRHICATGLAKDPARRFQSAGEMIEQMRRYIDGRYDVKCMFTLTKRMLREGGRMVDRRPRFAVGMAMAQAALSLFGVGSLIYFIVA